MPDLLPLFPLGSVLYPGLVLPLHVFEERYRVLVATLVDRPVDAAREFGVVAIRVGHEVGPNAARTLYDVGCSARLAQVTAHPDGRYDLVTTGARRFRLTGVDDSLQYLVGEVEWLDEDAGEQAPSLVPKVTARFQSYRRQLNVDLDQDSDKLPTDPVVLSYLVSAAMLLDLDDKQRLLAAPDAASRLRLALGLLRREQILIGELGAIPAVDLLRHRYPSA